MQRQIYVPISLFKKRMLYKRSETWWCGLCGRICQPKLCRVSIILSHSDAYEKIISKETIKENNNCTWNTILSFCQYYCDNVCGQIQTEHRCFSSMHTW